MSMVKFNFLTHLFFIYSLGVYAGDNGKMSTFGSPEFEGMNGIMETVYSEDFSLNGNFNGIRTEIEPQDATNARGMNGAMDVFDSHLDSIANSLLVKPIIDLPSLKIEVFFPVNKYSVSSSNLTDTQQVLSILKNKNIDNIGVLGYADPTGTKEYNQKLSQKRADEFKKWLIAHGIASQKIISIGKGIDSHQEDFQKARRIEIIITLKE